MKNNKNTILCEFCNRKAVVMYYPEVALESYKPLLSGLPLCRIHDRNALKCLHGAKVFKD